MRFGHTVPLAALLVLTGVTATRAQAPQQQLPPCYNEFMPLRAAAEKRAQAIQAASKRKAGAEEACGLFKRFYDAEAKVVNYAVANATWCGIPDEAIKQMKDSHEKTNKVRIRICKAAKAGPPRPRGPSLGQALGTTPVPDASTTRTGRGTYDTLTGNPLAR